MRIEPFLALASLRRIDPPRLALALAPLGVASWLLASWSRHPALSRAGGVVFLLLAALTMLLR